jgi:hypothetical protein
MYEARTRSDFFIEHWGGRSIDPSNWTLEEFTHGARTVKTSGPWLRS